MGDVKGILDQKTKKGHRSEQPTACSGPSAPPCRVLTGFEPAYAGGDVAGWFCFANTQTVFSSPGGYCIAYRDVQPPMYICWLETLWNITCTAGYYTAILA